MIDRIEPVPDRGPVIEPVARARLLTPVEREAERRRREDQRRRRAKVRPEPSGDAPGEAGNGAAPRIDVRG
jgi:hypothetical protein